MEVYILQAAVDNDITAILTCKEKPEIQAQGDTLQTKRRTHNHNARRLSPHSKLLRDDGTDRHTLPR